MCVLGVNAELEFAGIVGGFSILPHDVAMVSDGVPIEGLTTDMAVLFYIVILPFH